MSKLKKVLLMGTAYVLVAALAIGGTIAYLTDTDSDVNVMTMGNVSIAQHEYQRVQDSDGAYVTDTIDNQTSYVLEEFEQGKALLPATDPTNNGAGKWDSTTVRMSQVGSYGGMQVFVNPNAQDKFVTVENTGKTDAYVRTLVAIECGDGDASLIGASFHNAWTSNAVGKITVDGNNYYVFEYMYKGAQLSDGSLRHGNGVLPAGDTTYPNLSQVYLKSAATNEDCEALDGNDNGTLDILVLSQAAQTAGFADAQTALDTAFGTSEENAAEWFGGVIAEHSADAFVDTAEELVAALEAGKNVVLTDDIELGDVDIVLQNWTVTGTTEENGATVNVVEYADKVYNINLNGYELSATAHAIELHGGTLNIKNGTISMDSATQDGTFITVGGHSPVYDAHKVAKCGQAAYNPASVLNLENVTFEGSSAVDEGFATSGHAIYVNCHGQVHIRNCTFDLVMENGVYANPFDVNNNASDGVGDGSGSATVVYVYEGTKFYGDPTYQAWKDAVNADWEVNGGIRVYIADGYKLETAPIADGDTYAWYTVVAE